MREKDINSIIVSVFDDLKMLASSEPNERLPKEEQIRSCIFSVLRGKFQFLCVERGYQSIDKGSSIECDLWARKSKGAAQIWIECKRCWSGKNFNNKPTEQLDDWLTDIKKLGAIGKTSERYFFLFGIFNCDPLVPEAREQDNVVKNIFSIYPGRLIAKDSIRMQWPNGGDITHSGAWVWCWPVGVNVEYQ